MVQMMEIPEEKKSESLRKSTSHTYTVVLWTLQMWCSVGLEEWWFEVRLLCLASATYGETMLFPLTAMLPGLKAPEVVYYRLLKDIGAGENPELTTGS